jgi:hypothetical protein
MQFKLVPHLFAVALVSYLLTGQKSPVNGPSDLRVELRSASGSNSFKVGDPIQLEVVFSSKARGKYLEPCGLMFTHNFGLPLCRYYTKESASIKPGDGWTEANPIETSGGPFLEVPDHDLSSTPVSQAFLLTDLKYGVVPIERFHARRIPSGAKFRFARLLPAKAIPE